MRDESLWFQTHKSIQCWHTWESHRRFASTVLFVLSRLVYKSIITKQNKPRRTQSISWTFTARLSDDTRAQPCKTTRKNTRTKELHFASCKVMSCCSPSQENNARKAGPAKLSLGLASSMENIQEGFLSVVALLSPSPNLTAGCHCGHREYSKLPVDTWLHPGCCENILLSVSVTMRRLGYGLFAEPKHCSSVSQEIEFIEL